MKTSFQSPSNKAVRAVSDAVCDAHDAMDALNREPLYALLRIHIEECDSVTELSVCRSIMAALSKNGWGQL